MKFEIGSLAAALMIIMGCAEQNDGETGLSRFAVDNDGTDTVFAVFVSGGIEDTTEAIPPDSILDFTERSEFGSNPTPSGVLQSLTVLRKKDSSLLRRQEPILDSAWIRLKLDTSRYGLVRYLFKVSGK